MKFNLSKMAGCITVSMNFEMAQGLYDLLEEFPADELESPLFTLRQKLNNALNPLPFDDPRRKTYARV